MLEASRLGIPSLTEPTDPPCREREEKKLDNFLRGLHMDKGHVETR